MPPNLSSTRLRSSVRRHSYRILELVARDRPVLSFACEPFYIYPSTPKYSITQSTNCVCHDAFQPSRKSQRQLSRWNFPGRPIQDMFSDRPHRDSRLQQIGDVSVNPHRPVGKAHRKTGNPPNPQLSQLPWNGGTTETSCFREPPLFPACLHAGWRKRPPAFLDTSGLLSAGK